MNKLVYFTPLLLLNYACGDETQAENNVEIKDTVKTEEVIVEEPAPVNSFILDIGSVGIFKIGQPFPHKLPTELNSRKANASVNINGVQENHIQYVIFNSLEDVLEVNLENNSTIAEEDLVIINMKVLTGYYETNDGIAVGKTLNSLLEKYPETKLRYDGTMGEVIGETEKLTGITFVISKDGLKKQYSGNKNVSLNASNFNDEAKISAIIVN